MSDEKKSTSRAMIDEKNEEDKSEALAKRTAANITKHVGGGDNSDDEDVGDMAGLKRANSTAW